MTSYQGGRVTVPRDLWISALADAIDWTSSLLDSQHMVGMENPAQEQLLARYRKAYKRATAANGNDLAAELETAARALRNADRITKWRRALLLEAEGITP